MFIKNLILFAVLLLHIQVSAVNDISLQNVIWNTPSETSFGSMPLGNGDIGLNVWSEKSGDIVFYISKVNAYDSKHLNPKLGKVRMKFYPSPTIDNFRQELSLEDATIRFFIDDISVELCVSANQSIVNITGKSKTPRIIEYSLEPLRKLSKENELVGCKGTVGILLPTKENELGWMYQNRESVWLSNLIDQTSEDYSKTVNDPIMGRCSGCLLRSNGFNKSSEMSLVSNNRIKKWDTTIRVESLQSKSSRCFLDIISENVKFDKESHNNYWKDFWNRSYINVYSCGDKPINLDQCRYTQVRQGALAYEGHNYIDANKNAKQITQRYALERFCQAIASRGEVPPQYNGSIFTMDMPAGVMGFNATKKEPISPDKRDWGVLSFMWQNTRHPYWGMAARGDYDCMINGMKFVRDGLDICKERCKKIFGHDGAFIMEASWWHNVGVFNWNKVPSHLKYHMLASLELPLIMCQYYEHTRDKAFLDSILLPCADEFIKFYQLHYPVKDENGKTCFPDVGCAETYQGVTNPCTEIGALKLLISKLCSFDISEVKRNIWIEYLRSLPDLPLRTIRGRKLLAVGDKYLPGRTNCESPELYSVYPFMQVWLGKPEYLSVARQSFFVRTISLDGTEDHQGVETGGWQSAPVQAAYLGLPREAARLMSINFNDQFVFWNDNIPVGTEFPNRPRPRFPAFWECKMDGTPDNDHGANSVNSLQSMLLISDNNKIYLMPAWPEDWDVSFKLNTNNNTTVECQYINGKIKKLKVTPEYRAKDIVDMTSQNWRIRNMVQIATTDYNYLYSLPPMIDAQPIPGPVTSSWIDKYGYTLRECKAGPWNNALYKGNKVYLHLFEIPKDGIFLPTIGLNLNSVRNILGESNVEKVLNGYIIKSSDLKNHKIVELEFDGLIEPYVIEMFTKEALNKKEDLIIKRTEENNTIVELLFNKKQYVGRFDMSISNPKHLRGKGKKFYIEYLTDEGVWLKAYEGAIYGMICSKEIPQIYTSALRLNIESDNIVDLYYYK